MTAVKLEDSRRMKIISHRCNLKGPDKSRENNITAMRECIAMGYDVEIDVWYQPEANKLYLGHDAPLSYISWDDLKNIRESIWIHCKNLEALYTFTKNPDGFNYFWHESDAFTLTSKNYIWTYPGKNCTQRSIMVMPEWEREPCELGKLTELDYHGICTDYPMFVENKSCETGFPST